MGAGSPKATIIPWHHPPTLMHYIIFKMLKFPILFSNKSFLKETIEFKFFLKWKFHFLFDYSIDNLLRFPTYYGVFFSICKICKINPVGFPSLVGKNMRNPNFLPYLIRYMVCNFDCTIALYWLSL